MLFHPSNLVHVSNCIELDVFLIIAVYILTTPRLSTREFCPAAAASDTVHSVPQFLHIKKNFPQWKKESFPLTEYQDLGSLGSFALSIPSNVIHNHISLMYRITDSLICKLILGYKDLVLDVSIFQYHYM